MSLPTKSEIDKNQVNTTNKSIANNQSDFITLNIYKDTKNEEKGLNINDTQANSIKDTNNNDISKRSVMQPQNNYLYLDNVRGNNYPYSDNLRNQMYPNNNLNAYNQYGYNRQYNPMLNMNYNSPNGNPANKVNIVDPTNPTNAQNLQNNQKSCCKKTAILPIIGLSVLVILMIVAIAISSSV